MRKIFRDQTSYVDLDDSLVRYASELCVKRPSHGTAVRRMETTGAQFDPSGRFLVADVSLFPPVLYAIGSPEPLATMSSLQRYPHMSPCLPKPVPASLDKYAGYRNSCTVKRGSFGFESQTGHLYYVTGSDDFRRHGWVTMTKASIAYGSAPRTQTSSRTLFARLSLMHRPLRWKARAQL